MSSSMVIKIKFTNGEIKRAHRWKEKLRSSMEKLNKFTDGNKNQVC